VLSDPEKRKKYDELGANWRSYQQQGGNGGGFDWSQYTNRGGRSQSQGNPEDFFGGEGGFSDFFETLFGGGGRRTSSTSGGFRSRAMRGQDVQAEMELSLEEAYHGGTKQVSIDGQKVNMKLKPGVHEGQLLRMKGKGGAGMSRGESGDLIITIHLSRHARFTCTGNDLHFEQPVDLVTAVLGGKINVTVFDKTVKVDIPASTDSGKIFRLKGMGMPVYENPAIRGDAYLKVMITVPKNLSPKEQELFKQLANG